MRRILTILAVAALASCSLAPRATAEVTGGFAFSQDSDQAEMHEFYTGYRYSVKGSGQKPAIGFQTGLLTFRDSIGTEYFRVLEVTHRSSPFGNSYLNLEGRLLDGDWSPFLYSGNFSYRPSTRWYLELSGEREIVDTVTCIQLQYLIDTKGFSIDYSLDRGITLVAGLFEQDISDGNNRTVRVGKIIYSPPSHENLNFQVRARIIDNDFEGIGYFSPETWSEYFFLVGLSHTFANDNWVFKGLAGPGLQRIENFSGESERKSAVFVETKLRGWFTQEFGMNGKVGYTTAQKTSHSDRYVYGEVNFVYTW